jgi:hypothetical protein
MAFPQFLAAVKDRIGSLFRSLWLLFTGLATYLNEDRPPEFRMAILADRAALDATQSLRLGQFGLQLGLDKRSSRPIRRACEVN